MAVENKKGVYISVHTDKRGTSHIDFYGSNPRTVPHESYHIDVKDTGKGRIVEKDTNGNKTTTYIDINKSKK